MVRKLESPLCPDHIIHSQGVLARRIVVLPILPEHSESLWTLVTRICDRYMPQLLDSRSGPQIWRTPWESVQQ
jgi:hypothetical protein